MPEIRITTEHTGDGAAEARHLEKVLFERAAVIVAHVYEQTPRDESPIRRIYLYSDWCAEQPRGRTAADDLLTCVAVCFYEHIPLNPGARADMPRWWRPEDLADEPSIFRYHLSDDQFNELRTFLSKENHRYEPRPGTEI